ncbi:MAG: N-acyl-D-amino-acid deacylase family protein [Actinomycetota bacterium]
MADLLVAGALIVDGSGAPARTGSVVVSGDRIESVVDAGASEPEAARRLDGQGLALAPGFVDAHSHSDATPFVEPSMDSMLRQGVTTLIVGNCGMSAFPPSDLDGVASLVGASATALGEPWRTFDGYLERVRASGPALNVAALVGHGSLRLAALEDKRRPPTADEAAVMAALLDEALDQGALGMSTGLIYAPGMHAATDEIAELARAMARRGGVYVSHVRGEGRTVFDAVAECIRIGERAGVPSHVSHLKVEGPSMWGRSAELLALIDDARASGADVSADQYPYTAWETELAAALPPWVTAHELPAVNADPAARERLLGEIELGGPSAERVGPSLGWERIVVGSHVAAPELTGRTIADLAGERGTRAAEIVVELLLADPNTGMVGHGMHEDDVRAIVSRPDVFVGTDGVAIGPGGPLGAFAVHPRYYGTFPRVLGRYVREERLLTLEDAVRKMTSLPARRFGLAGRGTIEAGAFADLVLFDPARVADRATYERPHTFADGIAAVVLNGRVAWDGSGGERAGRALRRNVHA